jgi:pyrroline-5-carboxylate reductase
MAVETMLGTALLLLERKLTFSELISQVATPGGCTAEGLKILEKSLPGIMDEIYEATCNRQEAVSESVRKALSH